MTGDDAPWLSVLVPVYNARPYLERCLASLGAQLPEGVEWVFLDDGSTDGSTEMVRSFVNENSTTRRLLPERPRQGVAAARNHLLDAARGDYIWYVDADDEMAPDAIAQLRGAVNRHRPDLVLCDFRILRERSGLRHRLRGEAHRPTFDGPADQVFTDPSTVLCGLFARGEFHVWSKIVRRSAWPADLRFPTGHHFEDLSVVPRLILACERCVYVPRPWIGYRSHPGSALGSIDARKLDDWWLALRTMADALSARPQLHPDARRALAAFTATSFLRMRSVASRLGVPTSWEREHLGELKAAPWMRRGLASAHWRSTGRWWRLLQARAIGLG